MKHGFLALSAALFAFTIAAQQPASGWTTLFDGASLNNWTTVGNANWKLGNGVVEANKGTGFLLSKDTYRDFELRAELWVDGPANSGVFVRCTNTSDITSENSYEVNVFDTRPDQTYATGSIVSVAKSAQPMKAADKWNTLEIRAEGTHLEVTLNGVKTVDVRDSKYTNGPIALQAAAGTVRFRKVEIRQLAQSDKAKAQTKGGGGLIRPLSAVQADLKGKLDRIKVHGKSLEGNLTGDDPDREVFVYLPPSYARETSRRYPVIYMLHGYGLRAEQWVGFINVAAAEKHPKEMIVVMPDARTAYDGSFYSNSKTTGDWERYIAQDLVSYIDSHYRTKANRASRGLGGHSMGGYGTFRIGMKYPDVFSSLYSMSAGGVFESGEATADLTRAESLKTKEDVAKLGYPQKGPFARGAAWSSNPGNPPLFLDLAVKDGKVQPGIAAKWMANSLLVLTPHHASALQRMKAIHMDVGRQDNLLISNTDLDRLLTELGVKHQFETYEGDHNGKVPERFDQHVLPFFSEQLTF